MHNKGARIDNTQNENTDQPTKQNKFADDNNKKPEIKFAQSLAKKKTAASCFSPVTWCKGHPRVKGS